MAGVTGRPVKSPACPIMHHLLFSGHMIDRSHRTVPRFPEHKEAAARNALGAALMLEKEQAGDTPLRAIAGGACGGDILFHEACRELGIYSEVYLSLPPESFKKTSVLYAGHHWADRLDHLLGSGPWQVLPQNYLRSDADIWEATNDWMLEKTWQQSGGQFRLIVLWDGNEGDNKGGTAHMVLEAQRHGIPVRVINTSRL